MDLFQGPFTRARAKKMKELEKNISNEMLALAEKAMKEGLKFMNEDLKDVCKAL